MCSMIKGAGSRGGQGAIGEARTDVRFLNNCTLPDLLYTCQMLAAST